MNIPVILIWETQEPAGDTTLLQDIEQRQAFRHRKTVVLVAVDNQLGGIELQNVLRR